MSEHIFADHVPGTAGWAEAEATVRAHQLADRLIARYGIPEADAATPLSAGAWAQQNGHDDDPDLDALTEALRVIYGQPEP